MPATVALRAGVRGAVAARVDTVGERPAVVVRCNSSVHLGALSEDDGATIAGAARLAVDARLPLVAILASSGADIGGGLPSLHGWGQAAHAIARCSGVVPVAMAVTGPAVSGPALLLGLADLVAFTTDAYAFVSGPVMVAEFTGVQVSSADLGGAPVHARQSGVASLVAPDEHAAIEGLADALAYLPLNADELPPRINTDDPVDRATPELTKLIPPTATGGYDVRDVARAVADDGVFLELWARFAPNLVVGLASVGGLAVGVVANQPSALAGTLDIVASQKGARFVNLCDSMNLPIVTLVDTPGFFPGKDLEWRGMIRHGAELAFAYARASVPRVCVVLRKAYGGAFIVMDCKGMGNDLCVAWPTAEIAVMGAQGAVQILHRRADADERMRRQVEYEAVALTPYVAADRGLVDEVIDPADTRRVVGHALALLHSKREVLDGRKHSNSPL